MINAVLKTSAAGFAVGFEVKGHSGSAPRGRDIVCAAVSSITQTALIGLDEVAGIKGTYVIKDADIECNLPKDLTDEEQHTAHTIIMTMWLGLESIAEQYQEFVRLKEIR
ncbi:MAG: ribosomal-processing cysteine protease Prp [Clostridia bacterium]|nr:ribosomal-processing cysteine protease Prp [Clostridia bacterium]